MTESSVTTFDEALVSKEFMADPYPLLRQLREEDPVHWSDSIGGWVLTRYDDMVPTFKDTAHYGNEGRLAKAVEYLPPASRANFKTLEDHFRKKSLLQSDPPDHTRLRALIVKVFTPAKVEAMRPRIREIVNGLLDSAEDRGQMDIIDDLAITLPINVLGGILGVSPADQVHVKGWADGLLAFQGVNKPGEDLLERSQKALVEIREYLTEQINDRRRQPREDLLSQLVAVEAEGERLNEQELIYTCITLLVAGHETTTSLIGNGLYSLLRHDDQWRLLQKEPSLLVSAIEETLRYESPVARQPRLIRDDVELGGKLLRKGQMAFQMLNAANRDPAYFSDPDRMDIRREKNRHIAFGLGAHFCVGATLARTEGQEVFRTILERFPKLKLKNNHPDWDLAKPNSRMLKTLHVEFS